MPELPDQVRAISERTRATRERAQQAARALLEQAGLEQVADSASERVGKMLEDVLSASRSNRRLIERLVADEFEKVADRLGFARQSEIDELRREIAVLRREARVAKGAGMDAPSPGAHKAGAKKAGAKQAGAKQAGAEQAPAKPAAGMRAPADAAGPAAKKAPAAKRSPTVEAAAVKKSPTVKKAATKRGAVNKAPAGRGTAARSEGAAEA